MKGHPIACGNQSGSGSDASVLAGLAAHYLPGMTSHRSLILPALLAAAAFADVASAQSALTDTTRPRPAIFRARDLVFAAGVGGAVAAAMSADEHVHRSLQSGGAHDNALLKGISNATGGLGDSRSRNNMRRPLAR